MQFRLKLSVFLKVLNIEINGKNAVRTRRLLVHRSGTDLSYKSTSHQEVNALFIVFTLLGRQILQGQVATVIPKQIYL